MKGKLGFQFRPSMQLRTDHSNYLKRVASGVHPPKHLLVVVSTPYVVSKYGVLQVGTVVQGSEPLTHLNIKNSRLSRGTVHRRGRFTSQSSWPLVLGRLQL